MKTVCFRKGAFCVFTSLAAAGMLAFFTDITFTEANPSLLFGAFIVSGFIYAFWLIGWHSAVRMNDDGIIVDNLIGRERIPWGEVAQISAGNGLLITLRNGKKIDSFTFGGSVIGALTGDKYTKRVAARMEATRQEILSRAGDRAGAPLAYRDSYYASPWPPLVILASLELIAGLGLLVHGG